MGVENLILLALIWLSAGATSLVKKCCPNGEVFSGQTKVDCVSTPSEALELYSLDYDQKSGFLICEEIEDVTTTPLRELNSTDFLQLQVQPCIDILHVAATRESVPIVAYCRSSRDRDENRENLNVSLPQLLDVRRCCPKDNIFDARTKSCVSIYNVSRDGNYSSDVDEFLSFFPRNMDALDFLKITRGLYECPGAMFTYEISVGDITFENGALQVMLPRVLGKGPLESFAVTEENTCLELTTSHRLVARVCRPSELCQNNSCIRKCCPEDQSYVAGSGCTKNETLGSPTIFYEKISNLTYEMWRDTGFGLMMGLHCENKMYSLNVNEVRGLTAEGYLLQIANNKSVKHDQHCLDVFYNTPEWNESLIPLICFPTTSQEPTYPVIRFAINSFLEGVSCFFLVLTLLVYICLPALQNLHGKTLMCHAASLLLAYTCLSIISWVIPHPEDRLKTIFCALLGYTMLFAFLSAFSWLNIMCFDIWRTFGRLRGNTGRGESHGKRFFLYCLYAWGLAIFMTMLVILSDKMQLLSENLRPNFGETRCWFTSSQSMFGELIFFRGPIAIQLISNVVFFILTSEHCSKVKAEIRRVADPSDPRSKRFHADKTKLIMNIKLFIVMGITWIAEIASSFLNQYTSFEWKEMVFYASDAINCLQGLLIFILFVLKPRVYQALRKRLGFDEKKKCSSQATSTLQDPYKVKKSASNSTLTSSFAVSSTP